MTELSDIDIESSVAAVTYSGPGYIVSVTWRGDTAPVEIDLAPLVFGYKVFRPLRDLGTFKTVQVEEYGYGLDWPGNDDLDMSPDQLRQLERAQKAPGIWPSHFREWLRTYAGTAENAAELLGLSKRTVQSYAIGETPVDFRTTCAIGMLNKVSRTSRFTEGLSNAEAMHRAILRGVLADIDANGRQ